MEPAATVSQQGDWWQRSPCPQLVLDATASTVLEANEAFWHWSGLHRDDVLGSDFARLLPVGDRILWSTHCLPKLETSGRVSEVSVQVVGAARARRAAFLTASRTSAPAGGGADGGADGEQVLVALFGAAERRRYEEDLLDAKRRAEASEAQRARAEQTLQHLAHHDPVTGLLNRRGLQVALTEVLAAAATTPQARGAAPSASAGPVVLFMDLDGFKQVNDSIGHAGGDVLLVTVAQRLRAATRTEAVLARFAGDEFVVVVDLPAGPAVDSLCQRLLAALAEPVVIAGVEVVVSASIGVARRAAVPDGEAQAAAAAAPAGAAVDAVVRRGPPVSWEELAQALLQQADAAMYQVKHSGRGGWLEHDPGAADPAADRLRLLEQLRHAVPSGQLRVHYQPRVSLADGTTTGVEALVRWQHPERGLLAPAHFIEVAESSGLVRELGAWVLGEALAQASAWNAAGRRLQVSVNVSARQLADPGLLSVVTSALARWGVSAHQLVLEITETALMSDPDAAARTLAGLAALGVQIAVDDFGTGYASLTYLRRFPVHELKVDRSFVAGLARDTGDTGDRAIVAGCVQLAHALGLVSVAEGVETTAQRDVLRQLGCQVAQGYLFGRPRPPAQLWL